MLDDELGLDELELVAAAAGYHYYKGVSREVVKEEVRGPGFMSEVLEAGDDVWREMFRMDKRVFHKLTDILREEGLLRDTAGVMVEEQLGMFLNIIGHNERNRVVQERFRHSGETISRHFNNVLKAIKSLAPRFMHPPPAVPTPPEILLNRRFYPYFQDCIGVIDSMHIPAHVPPKDQSRFRNHNGDLSQNVLAVCTFDLKFIFVYPGWEGSATDSRVLRAVLEDPLQNFPTAQTGKYYVGYSNMEGFMAPYEGVRCGLSQFRGANQMPRNAKELFNHRHSSLRSAVHKCFHVLKTRFPVLKVAPQYAFHVQRDIVIAACVLHNYIRTEEPHDWLFATLQGTKVDHDQGTRVDHDQGTKVDDVYSSQHPETLNNQLPFSLRDSIATTLWDDFLNNWDDW